MSPDPDPAPGPAVEAHEWQRAEAALEGARALRQPWRWCEALVALARCERRSGQARAAAMRLDDALTWARLLPARDLLADLLCERGELAADSAATAAPADAGGTVVDDDWLLARACAAEAAALAGRTSDPAREVLLLLRASDLFNRLGRADEATALQVRALQRRAHGEVLSSVELQPHHTLQ